MASKDDFFVTFGSNAKEWAAGLEAQLKPARKSVQNLQNLLDAATKSAGGITEEMSRALGHSLPKDTRPPPATRTHVTAAQGLGELTNEVAAVVAALKTIPASVANVKRSLTQHANDLDSNNRVQQRQGAGGLFQQGKVSSAENAVNNSLNRLLKGGIDVNIPDPARLVPQMNIRSVGMDAIQKSQIDRIVKAIERQTKDLTKALKNVKVTDGPTGGGGGGGTAIAETAPLKNKTGKKPSTKKLPEVVEAEKALDARRKELVDLEKKIVGLTTAISGGAKVDSSELDKLKAQRTAKAKEVAALERLDTTITRGDQKKARRAQAAAERAAQEQKLNEARERGLSAFNTLMDPNFGIGQVGKGKGLLKGKDLRYMADVMSTVGTPVSYGKKTTNDQLVERLLAGRASHIQAYGSVPPDQLTGRIKGKPDQISKAVVKLFNDIESAIELADEQINAKAITALNTATGGGRASGIGKSRTEYGAAFFDDALPLSRGAGGLTSEVDAARNILKQLPDITGFATENLRRKKFDPYSPEMMSGVEGGGTRATAFRLLIRALRDETTRIDELVDTYADLKRSIDANDPKSIQSYLNRFDARREEGRLKATDTPEAEQDAIRRLAANQRAINDIERQYGDLFSDPKFLEGRERRRDSRMEYEERQNQGRYQLTDYDAIQQAYGQAVVGLRNAIGSRETISNLPGLRYHERGEFQGRLSPRDPRDRAISNEDLKTLNSTFSQFQRSARTVLTGVKKGETLDTKGLAQAMDFMETSANNFANKLFSLFGTGPTVEGLIGQKPTNETVIADETERLATLDKLEQERARKMKAAPAEKLARAEYTEAQTKEQLAAAKKREREVSKRLTETSALAAASYAQLTQAQKTEYDKHVALAVALEQQADAVRQQISAQSNITKQVNPQGKLEYSPNELPPSATKEQQLEREVTSDLIQQYARLKGEAGAARAAAGRAGATVTTTSVETRKMTAAERKYAAKLEESISALEARDRALQDEANAVRYTKLPSGVMPGTEGQPISRLRGRNAAADVLGYELGTTGAQDAAKSQRQFRAEAAKVEQELHKLQRELATFNAQFDAKPDNVKIDRKAGLYPGLVGDLEGEAKDAAEAVDLLTKELPGLEKATVNARNAVARAEKAKYATPEARFDYRTQLYAERDKLRKDQPYTKADISKYQSEFDALGFSNQQRGALRGQITKAEKKGDTERATALREQLRIRESEVAAARAILDQAIKTRARLGQIDAEIKKTLSMDEGTYKGDEKVETRTSNRQVEDTNKRLIAAKKREIAAAEENRKALLQIRADEKALPKGEKLAPEVSADRKARQQQPWTKEQLRTMRRELRDLERGGDGSGFGGGPGGTGTAGRGPGGSDGSFNILRQILNRLNGIHATLRSGLGSGTTRSNEPTSAFTGAGVRKTASPEELAAAKSDDEATRLRAIAEQRARAQRFGGASSAEVKAANDEHAKRIKITRDQYRESLRLAQAMATVSKETRKEAEELHRLNLAGADNATIAAQQVRVYNSVQRDLQPQDLPLTARRGVAGTIIKGAQPRVTDNEIVDIEKAAQSMTGFRDVGASAAENFQDGFAQIFPGKSFWSRVINTTGTFIVRNFAAGLVFGLTNALQQVLDQAIQTEATFIRVSAALESTNTEVGGLRGELQAISTDYGVALNDVYTTAAGLAGLFTDTTELAGATRVVAQLQTISGGALNATEAMGVLASTLSAFQALPGDDVGANLLPQGIEGMERVADVLTVIQNRLGTNIEVTAEGVSRMSGLARQMNLSLEETAVFTAQISKQTNQTGAAAGEQFSRILGALSTGRGRGAVVEAIGPQAEEALAASDYGQVFRLIISGWDDLSDAQKRNLTVSLAGQRQAAAFNALVNNETAVLNTLTHAENASGEATDRMAKLMATLNKQIDVLGTNLQNLASNLIRSGLLNFLGIVLKLANAVFGTINNGLTAMNDFADNNAFVGFLRDTITTMLGFAVAAKLLMTALNGIRTTMAQYRKNPAGFTEAMGGPMGATHRDPFGDAAEKERQRRTGFGAYGASGGPGSLTRQGQDINRAPITRGVAFALDKTVGAAGTGLARQITNVGDKVAASGNRMFAAIGRAIQRDGAALGNAATALREGTAGGRFAGLQNAPSGTYGRTSIRGGLDTYAASGNRGAAVAGKLSTSLNKMAASGVGADAAMIALSTGILAVMSSAQRHAQISRELDAGYKASFADPAKAQAGLTNEDPYFGKNYEAFDENFTQFLDHASNWDKGMALVGARFTNGIRGFLDPSVALSREFGTTRDFSDTYGRDEAQAINDRATAGLKSFSGREGVTSKGLLALQESYNQELMDAATRIMEDKESSDAQKQAALAMFEQARYNIGETTNNLLSTLDGMGGLIALTTDQIQNITELTSTLASTQGLTQVAGVDLRPTIEAMMEETGAQEGTRLYSLLERLGEGGNDSVDVAILNRQILREQVKELQNIWLTKLRSGSAEPDELDNIKSQLQGAMAQLASSNDQVIDGLLESGRLMAGEQANAGNFEGAMDTYADAMRAAERKFERNARKVREEQEKQGDFAGRVGGFLGGIGEGLGGLADRLRGERPLPQRRQRRVQRPPATSGPASGAASFLDSLRDRLSGAEDALTPEPEPPNAQEEKKGNAERRKHNARMQAIFQAMADLAIFNATKDITLQIAQTADAGLRAALESDKARMVADLTGTLASGGAIPGIDKDLAEIWGPISIDYKEVFDSQVNAESARVSAVQAQEAAADQAKADAATARQDAAALRQAQLGVSQAWADARGDAVASARVQVAMAKAAMAAARAELAAATTASESAQARIAILSAQAQLIGAMAAVQQAQTDLVQSQYEVSIALAEAAGKTVLAAQRSLAAARAALSSAMKRSGGKATAEVNAAKAEVIRAEAAARDAKLQDQLDTIDFNLEMDKITASSAIAALRNILKTNELTKEQRRSLMLQIKGMEEEMADSQWNFGNVKLPTPYQMRRYGEEQLKAAGVAGSGGGKRPPRQRFDDGGVADFSNGNKNKKFPSEVSMSETTQNINFYVNGADTAKVKKIIEDVTGKNSRTVTTSPRRRV